MLKCEVLNDTVIAIKKGSIVNVDEKQYELARKHLKPIREEEKKTEVQQIETAELPKAKKTRKK